ncbi:MAG: YdbH domain-containing protein [Thermodesulfobacteriota bacterium]|nr:YdbH domain-containing protein [Thermodesulfobacteriota bacterium]
MRKILRIIFLLAVFLFTGWTLFSALLPLYLHRSLLPSLCRKAGVENYRISLPLIGWSGASTGFSIGSADSPVLNVSSFSLDYRFSGLFRKQLKQVNLTGVELRCAVRENRLVLDDPSLQRLLNRKPEMEQEGSQPMDAEMGLGLERISVKQATLICLIGGREYRLPFEGELTLPDSETKKKNVYDFKGSFFPRGQHLSFSGSLDLDQQAVHLDFVAEKLDLERFTDFIRFVPGLSLGGSLDFAGNAEMDISPFMIRDLHGAMSLHHGEVTFGNDFRLQTAVGKDSSSPLTFELKAKPKADQSGWDWQVASQETDSLHLDVTVRNSRMRLTSPVIRIKGDSSDDRTSFDFDFDLPCEMPGEKTRLEVPVLKLRGQAHSRNGEFAGRGKVDLSGASLHQSSGLLLEGINIHFPLTWPPANGNAKGELNCAKISWRDRLLGGLDGKLFQEEKIIRLKADFNSALAPGLIATSPLSVRFENLKEGSVVQLTPPALRLSDFHLSDVLPGMKGVLLSAVIDGLADLEFGEGFSARARINLQDGSISLPEKNIFISGIETSLDFPRLPQLCSGTQQKLVFSSAGLNDFLLDGGSCIFTLESPDSFLLEQGIFTWAQGEIHIPALRFAAGQLPSELMLYCHQLKLTEILEQFGVENIKGDGTVNGAIPLTFKKGKLSFGESFLYSTPGEGGVIQIGKGDFLTAAIPFDTPQFAQLDFTQEALRNFKYDWAKLHLISKDDILILQLKLDGKPAKPLPFSYDVKTGRFHRLVDSSKQGIFQPIRLDVNFRLPLNDLLEYNDKIKDLFQ